MFWTFKFIIQNNTNIFNESKIKKNFVVCNMWSGVYTSTAKRILCKAKIYYLEMYLWKQLICDVL